MSAPLSTADAAGTAVRGVLQSNVIATKILPACGCVLSVKWRRVRNALWWTIEEEDRRVVGWLGEQWVEAVCHSQEMKALVVTLGTMRV